MAGKEIKQRIVLEGEKEYNQALKDANRNLKTLRSELKAETAELGKNATEQQKNETRAKNLKKQIAEQEKIVQTYKAALEEVKEKYGDNEDAVARWEQKLNDARAALANMKNGLEDVGKGLQGIEQDAGMAVVATKSVADSLGKIGDAGNTISSTIEGIFSGMLSVIKDSCAEVWALISETAARANNWGDIAGYWNTDAQEIQKWARSVQATQNDFNDLQNAVSKISLGDHEKIFKLTGVSWIGDADQWKYAMDVMSSLSGMDYKTQMDALENLFGEKRASKMKDLLDDWGKIQELTQTTFNGDETGFGMTSEGLQTMSDLYVQIGLIDEKWAALKDRVAEGLGVAAMGLTVSVNGALDGVAEFLNAENEEDKQAALTKIRTNIEDFFRKLGEILTECVNTLNQVGEELQKSDDPITKLIGDILVSLTESLQWMIDNQDAVKGAFSAIFGVWLIARLAAVAGKLSSILMQIETIKAFKGISMIAGAGKEAATQAAEGAAAQAAEGAAAQAAEGAAGGGLFASIRALAGKAAAGAANIGSYVGNSAGPYMDWFLYNTDVGRWMRGEETFEEVKNSMEEYAESVKHNAETFEEDWAKNPITQFFKTGFETNGKNAMALWNSIFGGESLPEAVAEVIEDELLDDDTGLLLSPRDRQAVEDYWDAIRDDDGEGTDAANAYLKLWENFSGNADDLAVFNKITEMIDGLKEFGSMDADLPAWWFTDMGNGEGGLSSDDIQGFRGLPGQMSAAVQQAVRNGISGIKVQMDGVAVGHLVAPTVGEDLGRSAMG